MFKRLSFLHSASLAVICFFFTGLSARGQSPAVTISFNSTGLASITYNGTNFLSYGDLRLDQVEFVNPDGSITNGSTTSTVAVDAVHQIQTRTYSWGTITETYSVVGSKLQLSVTVNNQSTLPIQGVLIEPFGAQFPSTIAEFAQGYPLMTNTMGQPAVQMLTYSTGAMAIADDDISKPLLLGFPNSVSSANASVPIALVTDRVSWYCGCFPTIVRPIPAGATDTYNFSLRFGPTGSTDTTLAPDIYQAFAAAFPATMPAWPDHRAIGSIHVATNTLGLTGWTTNPRGYLNDQTIDVTTPAGLAAFQQRMLQSANYDISLLQNMNAQGVIVWDIEGEQFGPYNGDPTQLATLAPEMDTIADQYFQRFTQAGFRVGVTIRPQQLVIAPGLTSAQQNFVSDPTSILLAKAQYAHSRWGATLFYVDSNVNSWTDSNPIDPTIFETLQAAMPDSLFFPEHWETQYWAYSAPYMELQSGNVSTPAIDRFTYPNAFSLIYTGDGDITDNFQALVTAVENGDILLYRSWYDDEPANSQVQSIYQAAGVKTASVTISINPPGTAVAVGQPEQFTATVAGTTNQQVTWSVNPGGAGTISPSGLYIAPGTAPSQPTVNIQAVSAADPTKIATATVSFVTSVSVAINQQGTSLTAGQTQQFTATVSGTSNQQVTWNLVSGPGSLSATGLYTAPVSIAAQQTVTVQATSAAEPAQSATATLTLTPSASLVVSPPTISLTAGQTQQFTATATGLSSQQVTWALLAGGAGTISSSGLYTAPSPITALQTVTVQTTSVADSTRTATASVTLKPTVAISVNPQIVSLSASQTQQFTATLTGTTNQQVTWTILSSGAGTLSSSGLYTAPAAIATQQTVTVQATSAADSTKIATASVTLTPTVAVTLNPPTISLGAGQTQQFTPTVTGTSNQQVTWTLLAGGAGTLSSSGLYTAPSSITAKQTVTVQATSVADSTKTATSTVTLTPPAAPICGVPSTNAFTGCYFNDTTLGTTGGLNFTRIDSQISFNWDSAPPGGTLVLYNYSVRWQGNFTFNAGPVNFTLSSDDGSILYVDGQQVVNDWSTHAAYTITQSYTVTAGTHLIELDYFQAGGGATANLSWTQQPTCGLPSTNAFTGCYFGDTTLGTSAGVNFTRVDPQINFNWNSAPPGGTLGLDNYSVKWQGNFTFNAAPYTFTLATDDGSILYVDGQPIINDWSTHAAYTITQSYTMTAGTHLIELDYFQAGGGASASLSWASAQQQVGVTVNPPTPSLGVSQTQQFTASVTGTPNEQVSWSILSGGPGSISSSGLYTAPASIATQQTVIVQATSAADPTRTATASITLTPPAVAPTCGSPSTNAFTGCYFNDETLGTTAGINFSRVDPQINFNWNSTPPGGTLGLYNYSVKWQGNFTFNAGPYVFTLATDDGSILYIDGQPIINDWSVHGAYTITQSYTMTAGTHLVELDYFQAGGGATANLSWASAQQQVGISVNPPKASLSESQTQQFTATVTGSTNQGVTWAILSNGPGTISSSGLYTAPVAIATGQTVTVQATSTADTTQTASAAITLTPPAVSSTCGAPSTNAFTGCYFNDTTLGTTSGINFSRVDPQISFNWSNAPPGGTLGLYNYSVKWQGNFTFNAGPYTFTLSSDDGSRLYVDGNLVISDWSEHAAYTITQSYTMTAGAHLIELDYYQAGGGASANLSWAQPPTCGAASTDAFTGCYFNDMTLGTTGGVAFSRVDPQINFNWSGTSPGGSLGSYNYSVKWQGNFTFNAEPYIFTLSTDDGSRLYIDGNLVIDDWSDHPAYTITQSYTISAGTHLIELDYYQDGGGASANLSWSPGQ